MKKKQRKITSKTKKRNRFPGKPVNRKYKDTLFRMIFRDRHNLLSLYNALNHSSYTNCLLYTSVHSGQQDMSRVFPTEAVHCTGRAGVLVETPGASGPTAQWGGFPPAASNRGCSSLLPACSWCRFEMCIRDSSNTTLKIINGSIRKIDRTNLTYVEPHRIIINDITFLAFNYSNEIFIENLCNKIKLSDLEDYLKQN